MKTAGSISASVAETLLECIGRIGGNQEELGAKVGLKREELRNTPAGVPLATFAAILESGAAECRDPTFGFELAKVFPNEGLGPVAELLMTSATVGDGLHAFALNLPALQSSTKCTLSVNGGLARIDYRINDPTVKYRVQDANFSLGMIYSMLSQLVGPQLRVASVEFEHSLKTQTVPYRKYFSCPLRFGQNANAICFPADYLDRANPYADIVTYRKLESKLSTQLACIDFKSSVKAWMSAGFALSAPVDINYAAAVFGMSLRSFQRKLSESEIRFLDLRNEVRTEIAKCMLADTSLAVTAIALHLGYSEASAFSRNFRMQTGFSPADYRALRKSDG
jgi:AraC-like DNA-binding protein